VRAPLLEELDQHRAARAVQQVEQRVLALEHAHVAVCGRRPKHDGQVRGQAGGVLRARVALDARLGRRQEEQRELLELRLRNIRRVCAERAVALEKLDGRR
jgi:hypothetical protein